MTRRRSRDRGSALMIATVIVLIVAAIGAAFFTITISRSTVTYNASQSEIAFRVAQSGIDATVFQMNNYAYSPAGTLSMVTGSINGGAYAVTVTPAFNGAIGTYTLKSVGTYGNLGKGVPARRGIQAVVSNTSSTLFNYGAFGDKSVHIDSNGYVDSYNSASGSYAGQISGAYQGQSYAKTNGNTGSNANITVDSNAKVFGNAVPGPGGAVIMGANAYVSGSTSAASGPKSMPGIVLPPAASLPPAALNVGSGGSATIVSGSYHYSSLTTDSNSSLTIKGPATIVVDHFNTDSLSSVTIDASGGPVTIYGTGWFRLDSNSTVSSLTQKPSDLQIFITTDNYTGFETSPTGNPNLPVKIGSNAALYAAVYAPNAILRLDSNGGFFGSAIGKVVSQDSNFGIHFDEALLTAGPPGPYVVSAWWEYAP